MPTCLSTTFCAAAVLLWLLIMPFTQAFADSADSPYSSIETLTMSDGSRIEKQTINGPPRPPEGYELERAAVLLPAADQPGAVNTLTVPAYSWVFGCSAVSAAMIAAFYDRNGYDYMYTGPTNGGIMPLVEDSSWGSWSDGSDTYPNNPLIASHNGLDGRAVLGSLDDYWISYGSTAADPYLAGLWTEHAWGGAIGDYMKTSQSLYGNVDGSTWFYNWSLLADPLYCDEMESYQDEGVYLSTLDGSYGRKLFYEARGYTVAECYNQKTDSAGGGFTFALFKAEIDAGRPVLLNLANLLEGHSVVGVGYDDAANTVYIHDTWDSLTHSMTWDGSYAGMYLKSVSIVSPEDCSDADGDRYGEKCWLGPDCNDSDAAVHTPATYYVDADGDGYGAGTGSDYCTATAPAGYSLDNTDCNDSDGAVHALATYHLDADGDGFGAKTTAQVCAATMPAGYSLDNTDCNDSDGAVHALATYYLDGDGDGYGTTAYAAICAAAAPAGFSSTNTDCNDKDAFYYDVCSDCEVKILPGALGMFLGEKEKTRRLLVLGKRGTVFDDTTEVRFESDAIAELSRRIFLKRFMLLQVSLDGATLGTEANRVLIGPCTATLKLVE